MDTPENSLTGIVSIWFSETTVTTLRLRGGACAATEPTTSERDETPGADVDRHELYVLLLKSLAQKAALHSETSSALRVGSWSRT